MKIVMKIKLFEEFTNEAEQFTFKTNNPTGRYRSFEKPYYDIKLNGNVVGSISPETPFKVRFMVMKNDVIKDDNPNCPWKWITLKAEHDSLEAAKTWVNEKIGAIRSQYELRPKLSESFLNETDVTKPIVNRDPEWIRFPNKHDLDKAKETLVAAGMKKEYMDSNFHMQRKEDTLKFINNHEFKRAIEILKLS
jgi:hypothetical protein